MEGKLTYMSRETCQLRLTLSILLAMVRFISVLNPEIRANSVLVTPSPTGGRTHPRHPGSCKIALKAIFRLQQRMGWLENVEELAHGPPVRQSGLT